MYLQIINIINYKANCWASKIISADNSKINYVALATKNSIIISPVVMCTSPANQIKVIRLIFRSLTQQKDQHIITGLQIIKFYGLGACTA
jgi:hypothetical protein